jgi:hypothetical protein
MAAAVELGEYFRSHAHAVYRHFGREDEEFDTLTLTVLRALERHGGWVGMKELHGLLGRHYTSEQRRAALDQLETAGMVVRKTVHVGGRTYEKWMVRKPLDAPDAPARNSVSNQRNQGASTVDAP